MKLEFPTRYKFDYPKENEKYYAKNNYSRSLKEKLLEASNHYCMYCGKRIDISGEDDSHLEHSVEKSNGKEESFLKNCKYNLSLACAKCNLKFKKIMIEEVKIDDFLYERCEQKECTEMCEEILKVYREYLKRNQIILQPHGVKNRKTKARYKIEYDIIKSIFMPKNNIEYSDFDKNFIYNHIARFGFNRERFNDSFIKISEEILEEINDNLEFHRIVEKVNKRVKENIMEAIFIEFIKKNCKDRRGLKLLCEFIMILSYI